MLLLGFSKLFCQNENLLGVHYCQLQVRKQLLIWRTQLAKSTKIEEPYKFSKLLNFCMNQNMWGVSLGRMQNNPKILNFLVQFSGQFLFKLRILFMVLFFWTFFIELFFKVSRVRAWFMAIPLHFRQTHDALSKVWANSLVCGS